MKKVRRIQAIDPSWQPDVWWAPPGCGNGYGVAGLACTAALTIDLVVCFPDCIFN